MATAVGLLAATAGSASAEVRSLKLYHLHTHEKAEIVYKRNGRYVPEGLKKIDYLLRDWRRNEPTRMDPRLLDLVWEAYRESGATGYIQVICGYRAPATNALLRSRSKGVAQKSQHMLGKAMDFYIQGVSLKTLRDIGLKMQGGGVGYYPTSGSPFVHMDIGNVRHWPGISRQELARVFPNGKTLHVPSDGKPLPGYEQAMAAYKSRKASGTPNIELASAGGTRKSGGLLAALFGGGGADEADDMADVASAEAPAPRAKAPKPAAQPKGAAPGIAIVAPENAQRADIQMASDEEPVAEENKTPETIIAALPVRSVPVPAFAPRPKADVGLEAPQNVPFGQADATEVASAVPAPRPGQPVPGDVPFGAADAETATATREIAANNIPLPTWRPEHSTPPELAPKNQAAVLMALANTPERGTAAVNALAMLPSPRPGNDDAKVTQASVRSDEVKAMLEKVAAEKVAAEKASADSYTVAALDPAPRSVFEDSAGTDSAVSPRAALASRPAGSDPAAALSGVKTTRKEARPSPQDVRPERKATVVEAQPKAARWALQTNEQIVHVADATTAPKLAYNLVRTAPSEVYTAGFQPGNEMADAHKFSGNAVRFLSVARFQTK
ncbi:DUF882 domain-containing protein [Mesorhizobium sp. SP-1A]|uniref:DUF882 domain-containing protein n=1 Tax=Mesorhizobium sp. SP-1A TaxID=3077840 RepID=UPI0028F72F5E|nr:DUF882 domain-containing protein [Mesorhizobium sp. SP-1A]